MVIYTTTWEKAGFFPKLPDVLRPRILAAGYDLQAEDEGKQVYAYPAKNAPSLRVSYILTPGRTSVTFRWDSRFSNKRLADGAYELAKGFFAYLNEWFEAVGELEASDDS